MNRHVLQAIERRRRRQQAGHLLVETGSLLVERAIPFEVLFNLANEPLKPPSRFHSHGCPRLGLLAIPSAHFFPAGSAQVTVPGSEGRSDSSPSAVHSYHQTGL